MSWIQAEVMNTGLVASAAEQGFIPFDKSVLRLMKIFMLLAQGNIFFKC